MSNKEKRMIWILILITLLIIIVGIVMSINKGKEENKGNNILEGVEGNTPVVEEFVSLEEDGTKVNISNKLKETKTFDGLEIGNLQLTMKDNVSLILGEIKNVSDTARGEYPVSLTILDKAGNEIITIGAYIQELQPGQSAELNTSATFDFANAYDFRITKK